MATEHPFNLRRIKLRRGITLGLFLCGLVGWAGNSMAAWQDPRPAGGQRSAAKDTSEQDAKSQEVLAIVGADLYTVTQGVIRNGTIIIRDGKIAELGSKVRIPEGAVQIDAKGRAVTPGFIAISMQGIGLQATRPGSQNESLNDSLDPFDRNVKLALSVGITSGCAQVGGGGGGRRGRRDPEQPYVGLDPDPFQLEMMESEAERDFGDELPTCPCCGLTYLPLEPIDETPTPRPQQSQQVVVKMSYGSLDGMLANESAFYESPPGTLFTAQGRHDWRQQLEKARKYIRDLADHEAAIKAGERKQPPRNPVTDDIIRLVKKEIPMKVTAESVNQIRDMIALAKELDYRLIIERATEGWVIPSEISEAGVSLIITPRAQRQPRFGEENSTGSYIEMPRILAKAGVPFAVAALSNSISLGGLAGRDLSSLPLEALFAIRGGATESQALEAITINPARMLGMEDRIGSLEVGKDADLLILDGPPMDYRSYVEIAIVNGRQVYNRSEDRVMPVFERK